MCDMTRHAYGVFAVALFAKVSSCAFCLVRDNVLSVARLIHMCDMTRHAYGVFAVALLQKVLAVSHLSKCDLRLNV